jgi:glycyl-tRNA synthetase beta chain
MGLELLIEIGTEEIPARFSPPALKQMRKLMEEKLRAFRIQYGQAEAMCTPRRLTLCVRDVSENQAEHLIRAVGPPARVAYDQDGKPTKAAIGFARNQGVELDELKVEEMPEKGAYLVVEKKDPGKETVELLPQIILEWITSLSFPKNMRWGTGNFRFARPIHWILALFGGKVIPFDLDGIKSGSVTRGHRFIHPEPIEVKDLSSYLDLLERACVMCDPEKRMQVILSQAQREADKAGGRLREDSALLEEVTHLVEWPVALCGSFDPEFLELQEEVLVTSMRDHQKYFCIVDKNERLIPRFITISNTPVDEPQTIIKGNERVLRARLSDAAFFLEEDTKVPLSDRVDSLKQVVFQEQLGSLYDKVLRIKGLARYLADNLEKPKLDSKGKQDLINIIERGALLCKCDLVTEMVGEFPELEGIMGREYARRSGEPDALAQAIFEHYLPRFAGDKPPDSLAGSILSLADKMDTLAGCFFLGLIPTGSEDPHALRRQVQGMIQIILNQDLIFPWEGFVTEGLSPFQSKDAAKFEEAVQRIHPFLIQRLNNFFLSRGFDYDLINAVLAAENQHPVFVQKRLEALNRFRSQEVFGAILIPFKRVINILPDYGQKAQGAREGVRVIRIQGKREREPIDDVDPGLFREDEEHRLFDIFKRLEGELYDQIGRAEYYEALQAMVALKEPIDAFFDKVLVMEKDESLKNNRLALLTSIGRVFLKIADFSKIVQE